MYWQALIRDFIVNYRFFTLITCFFRKNFGRS